MSEHDDDEFENRNGEFENGHISLSDTNFTDGESSDDEPPPNTGQFDRDLPTEHKYLGKLNSVKGYTLYDDGEIVPMLAIYTNTLVFPGYTLPLIISAEEIPIVQRFIEKNNVFVLICSRYEEEVFKFGVTMEIFETQMRNTVFHIKARGRQRCKLVPGKEIRKLAGRLDQVTVKMLAEPPVLAPLCDTQLLALKNKRPLFRNRNDRRDMYIDKYRRYHLSQYPFASWVYTQYEVSFLVEKIWEKLSNFGEFLPEDPVQLSYWIVQNYQLCLEERLKILELNSAMERLKLELLLLNLNRSICCNNCGVEITDPSKIILMSKAGMQSNYVNPGGHVFETVTVSFAKNLELIGNPSTQFSWFPGYAWTIIQCTYCSSHLGWRFTSYSLKPNCFYGLSKKGVGIKVTAQNLIKDGRDCDWLQTFTDSFIRHAHEHEPLHTGH